MKYLIILFAISTGASGIAQTAKSFYFNGKEIPTSGVYIEKHPSQNAYFTAAEKFHSGIAFPSYTETVVSKIDAAGNTEWHSSVNHTGSSSTLSGLCDIKVNTTHIFVSTLITTTVSKIHIYKFDLNGALLDSLILTGSSLTPSKSEMDFDSNGNLFTLIQETGGDILFCRINPVSMDLMSSPVIGSSSLSNLDASRTLFAEFDGSDAVVGFNTPGNARLIRVSTSGSTTGNLTIPTPDGQMTDFTFQNSEYNLLINKYFTPSAPAANPLRIMKVSYAGIVNANTVIPVSHALLFENLAVDSDETIYVAARGQQTTVNNSGAIIKVSGGSLIYEYMLPKTNVNEVELSNTQLYASGAHLSTVTDCSANATGNALIVHPKATTPVFRMVAPQMKLEANNVEATISYNSSNFTALNDFTDGYEIAGAGNTINSSALLIAGEDINGNLKSSCLINGNVYAAGPVTTYADYTKTERDKWERVWIVSRTEIDAHIAAYMAGSGTYVMPEAIKNWPGNGDITKGQSPQMARYQDLNSNGIYEPTLGEYPWIKGDYCALSIYNDINAGFFEDCPASSEQVQAEVHEYIYGFNCTGDSALQNTLYIHYEIINKSSLDIFNSYVGNFVDNDIVSSTDDFISSDAQRGIFYARNGDGTGPEQAYLILGSTQDPDAIDNTVGIGANETINGLGYGDGTDDNERLGMTNFIYFNLSGGANGYPDAAPDYYKYLQSIWQNGQHVLYGGNGFNVGTTTVESDFMFQGDSDPLWYSTEGINPGSSWTEETSGNAPADRRGLASSGPFKIGSYDTIYFDIAQVTGMECIIAGTPFTSHEMMTANVDSARNYFAANETACGSDFDFYAPFNGTYPFITTGEIAVPVPGLFPNPTTGNFTINGLTSQTQMLMYNSSGQLISETLINEPSVNFDYTALPKGIYFVRIQSDTYSGTIKFVKQ